MHRSVPVIGSPIELINITAISPLISKCQIKVCYVGDEPNRNNTVITKEVAAEIAQSLPGSPIVGHFNQEDNDFGGHDELIEFVGNEVKLKATTQPYGFVDLGAKVWFQKFLDDDTYEREYLVTEGYLWTGQFPECERILENGNNQSMELDPEKTKGTWTIADNGYSSFFIINETIISKLCILGENVEPCFEGSQITAPMVHFSFDNEFKTQMFNMMNEIKQLFNEGGAKVENEVLTNEFEEATEEVEVIEEQNNEVVEEIAYEEVVDEENIEEEILDNSVETAIVETEVIVDVEHYNFLVEENKRLLEQVNTLNAFKLQVEKKEKEAMIDSFYMLSEEDKADVVANIDSYSLDDIEAKLSIICVRNKVSFNLEEDNSLDTNNYTVNVNEEVLEDSAPAWIKKVRATAEKLK